MNKETLILAIETSCDETSVSVIKMEIQFYLILY